mmetsp:Transcript_12563/g.18489  ORF Transcript_12563/g.18489 Transcript_12563/m.18489 type:complete len:290 (+) Transcript_12563:139-1008(+)
MSTWQRVQEAFGPGGYDDCMRKSLQCVVLYEANRCCAPVLQSLRPFQRKIAYYDMFIALVDSLQIVHHHQKEQLKWRTLISKDNMSDQNCWKRRTNIQRELDTINEGVRKYLAEGKTNEEALEAYLQKQFENVAGPAGKTRPPQWEHHHTYAFFCYKVYYVNGEVDPNFPEPIPPKPVHVQMERPTKQAISSTSAATAVDVPGLVPGFHPSPPPQQPTVGTNDTMLAQIVREEGDAEERRRMLQEVKDHLDLLKEFEGVIPPEDLTKRKRDLFLALPSAPPPATKKTKI